MAVRRRAVVEEDVIRGVDPEEGLSPAEVVDRLARFGPNVLVGERRSDLWRRLFRPLADPMVDLLLVAGLVFLALGEHRDAIVMLAAVIPVVLVDVALEARAERTLEQLRKLTAPHVRVRRAGQVQRVSSEEVVPGDVVLLDEGDVAPADGIVVGGADLQVDESALTGESVPASKEPAAWPAPVRAPEAREHLVFAGTSLLSGRATVVVTTTGARTEYGTIGSLVADVPTRSTPLQQAIGRLIRTLGVAALVVSVVVAGIELLRSAALPQAILSGVSLAIAAIPEEFPIVFTLYMTLGAWRMARRNALIRHLAGVETLGSATVVCSDKTGTLTSGRLAVAALYAGGRVWSGTALPPVYRELVEDAVLASEVRPHDPLDRAVHDFARSTGVPPEVLYREWRLVLEYPFDPGRKYVTHVWRSAGGHLRLCAKGAVEGILELCSPTEPELAAALSANEALTRQGMRVIAVGWRDLPRLSSQRWADEQGLRFAGLIGFADPPREGVRAAVEECQSAGVRVVMITGDHPLTAHAVAEKIGLWHRGEEVLTGADLLQMSDGDLQREAGRAAIYARIDPAQKYRIVRALQAQGDVVAMTGDGINDAPALRAADVGVAMGQRGTEVAREAATMVLLDDDFSTIVAAIREGRRIFDNLRRAFSYLVGFHLPIVTAALVVPLVGAPLLLLPIHIIWLEIILHPTSALVFQAEPPAPDLMRRPPRRPGEPFLQTRAAVLIVAEGIAVSLGVLGLYFWTLGAGRPPDAARALALATLVLAQVLLALQTRSPREPIWARGLAGNRTLGPVVAASLLTLALALYVPTLTQVARLAPLSPVDWLLAIAVSLATTLPFELGKGPLLSRF